METKRYLVRSGDDFCGWGPRKKDTSRRRGGRRSAAESKKNPTEEVGGGSRVSLVHPFQKSTFLFNRPLQSSTFCCFFDHFLVNLSFSEEH